MDPRWSDYRLFLSDLGRRPEGCTVERIDNKVGYWPDNCTWATPKQQAQNRCTNRFVEIDGERLTVAQAADQAVVSYQTYRRRLNKGWDPKVAMITPADPAKARSQVFTAT